MPNSVAATATPPKAAEATAGGSESPTLTVMLVDGETLVRSAIAHLLHTQEGIEVVATTGDPRQAAIAAKGHKPDVILYDPHGARGTAEAIAQINEMHEASPESSILILTSREDPVFARDAIRAGAFGYLLMSEDPEDILRAIQRAGRGRLSLSPRIAIMIAGLDRQNDAEALTERERDIVHLVALGYTNKEMADELHLSIRTVESHRANILRKLDVNTRAGLVRYALDNNLVA
jgi:two-component system response regulator NreC